MRSTTPLARLLAAGAFAAAMVPQTPVYAAPNVDQWQHILDCAGWMFSDPDRHRAECSPGHDFFLPGNNFSQTGITGEPPPPPPPPPEEICPPIPSLYVGPGGSARLIPVVCPSPCPGSYQLGDFGPALIQVDCLVTSPSKRWIVRPSIGLLV